MSQSQRVNRGFSALLNAPSSPQWRCFYAANDIAASAPPSDAFGTRLDTLSGLATPRVERVVAEVRRLEFHGNGLCLAELTNPTGTVAAVLSAACFDLAELPLNVVDVLDGLSLRPSLPTADAADFVPFRLGAVVELREIALIRPPRGDLCLFVDSICLKAVFASSIS